MSASVFWICVALILSYIVTQDPNVIDWLILQRKILGIILRRWWFLVRHNPGSPWVRYAIKRNADRIASEILKENENR